MASADDGYSSQEGLEEVLHLRVEVVSISRAKGKKLLEAKQWKSRLYRQARVEHSAIESLVFTLKEGFDGTAYQLACMLERDLALACSPSFPLSAPTSPRPRSAPPIYYTVLQDSIPDSWASCPNAC